MQINLKHVTVIVPAVSEVNIKRALIFIDEIQQQNDTPHRIVRLLDLPKRCLTPNATTLQR